MSNRSFSSQSGSKTSRAPNSLRSRAFPVVGWEKYDPVEFLGEGGMGRVYKVFDPVLRRHAALKFIRDEDDRLIRRFFREAQAQARIDHEFVCKVYDVGEVEGLPYIAMQYIDGKSLKEAAHQLTLDQKVTIVRQVALALFAAHRMGIIHRDIKPSNIMVEPRDDGSYHPYVMDFGLAREMAQPGETATGVIEGTPSYMAPEQARGDHKNLDRRVDIYSLGATLYHLIAQRPPFVGDSSLSVLLALDKEEATPLRKLVPSLPEDLEIIAMKCLEKDPGQRYDSAKALADDLERYLNGDPIAARRASLTYLLLKKIRKHKALFAVSCLGVLGISIAVGAVVRARVLAAEQAELSQQLGKDVKEMELLLRWAYALPLHDVSREKARIRDRMQEIEGRIERMGAIGSGPGHYALGRGHLALRDAERARAHLEKALSAGYGGPEVERALGRALGELYKKELEETNRIGDKKPRDERRAVIEKELLAPALSHLRNGGGDELESEVYMEGLIAFYNKQYGEALEKARISEERALSTYEAKKLRGDVYSALGTEKKEQGQGEQAFADYDRAAEAYEAARTIARSDASIYEAECEMWAQRMEVESTLGKSPKASFEKAQAACDGALVANPESGAAHGKKAWALWQYGGHLLWAEGKDPTDILSRAIEAGKIAVRLDPGDANTYDTIGISHVYLALYDIRRGKDPRPSFQRAAENLQRAIELHPNFAWAYNDLGGVHRDTGEYELSRGIDPTSSLKTSIAYTEKAIELNPSYHYPYTNIGIAHILKAQYELGNGRDPTEHIRLAIDICERSLSVNKAYFVTYHTLGTAYRTEARYRIYRGEAFDESIQKALRWFQEELQVNPTSYHAHLEIASIHLLVANELFKKEQDPSAALAKAESALQEMEKTGGDDVQTPLTRTKVLLLKARITAKSSKKKRDAEVAWQQAEAALTATLKLGVGIWEVFATGAEMAFWSALDAHNREKSASDAVKKGIAQADEGLAISPEEPPLLLWKAALLLLSSRVERGPDSGDVERKGKSFADNALRKNRFLEPERRQIEAALASE
jgi:serine/threonine-protein kinase